MQRLSQPLRDLLGVAICSAGQLLELVDEQDQLPVVALGDSLWQLESEAQFPKRVLAFPRRDGRLTNRMIVPLEHGREVQETLINRSPLPTLAGATWGGNNPVQSIRKLRRKFFQVALAPDELLRRAYGLL